jgi:hypothetical protein|tara:strand:- start:15 stop:314 length:300 start_codon:yes stop_codon:yes gene_type:complete
METIIYKTLPNKVSHGQNWDGDLYEYNNGQKMLCMITHLEFVMDDIYKYSVPTDEKDACFFESELDAVNFASNFYQFGLDYALVNIPSYVKQGWEYAQA